MRSCSGMRHDAWNKLNDLYVAFETATIFWVLEPPESQGPYTFGFCYCYVRRFTTL